MRHFTLLLFLLATACDAFDPTGVAMAPPAIYRQWFHEMEACSGLRGDFDLIEWENAYDIRYGITMYAGYWTPKHEITIRDDFALNEKIVKHEIMHELLQQGEHPALYFKRLCGDLMGV